MQYVRSTLKQKYFDKDTRTFEINRIILDNTGDMTGTTICQNKQYVIKS